MSAILSHIGLLSSPLLDPHVAALYWRVLFTDNNGNASYMTVVDCEFRATVGGADQTNATGDGLEYTALSGANYSNRAALAFDNDYVNTKLTTAAKPTIGSPQWLKVKFDVTDPFTTKVFVRELSLIGCMTGQSDMAPKDFLLQRSDNNTDWTTVLSVSGQTGWAGGERRNFAV